MSKFKMPIFIYFFAAIIVLAVIQTAAVIKNANNMKKITKEIEQVDAKERLVDEDGKPRRGKHADVQRLKSSWTVNIDEEA